MRSLSSLMLASLMIPGLACGGGSNEDGGGSSDSTGSTTTGEGSGTTVVATGETSPSTETSTGQPDTTVADTTVTDSDTTTTDPGTTTESSGSDSSSTGALGMCQVWEITYDLEGSEFEISDTPFGAGDQINTLTMPYDADQTVGPGSFVLRFEDMGGQPGGMAAMVSYQMGMHFLVDSGFTTVATDLDADAGPDGCGITTGTVVGTTLSWMPSAIVGHHSVGQILCNGGLCGVGGLPDGMPVPVDEVTDQPLDDFEFSADLSAFTMAQTVIAADANSTTAWTYVGTETSRQLVDAPACLCP